MDLDKILTSKEQEHASLLQRVDDIAREIAVLRRVRDEYLGSTAARHAAPQPSPGDNPAAAPAPAPAPAPAETFPWSNSETVSIATAPPIAAFDGTVAGLIDRYTTDERSPYFQLKHRVRENYDSGFKRLKKDVGLEMIADWSAEKIRSHHDEKWAAGGKVSMGRSIIAKLRLLASFGSNVLNDDRCIRLSAILSNMRFEPQKTKIERLTIDHARMIRATAREHFGWESISLAQAFQYELPMLWQVDIIGEWVPESEPGTSEFVKDGLKWVGGLRWNDIDENMIFRPTITSNRRNQRTDFDLKRFYSILEEINRIPQWRRNGPMIICETTGLPWKASEFRRKWRLVADKAGVPKSVKMGGRSDDKPEEEPELRAV